MTTKLARWSFVLALPLSAVLAAPAERAVEVPLSSTGRTATKSMTTTKAGATVTHNATVSRLDGKTVETVRPHDDPNISHSIHDWVPRTPTKASHTQTQSAGSGSAHRAHWWSRPQRVAGSQQAEEVKH